MKKIFFDVFDRLGANMSYLQTNKKKSLSLVFTYHPKPSATPHHQSEHKPHYKQHFYVPTAFELQKCGVPILTEQKTTLRGF